MSAPAGIDLNWRLPCDVQVAPITVIKKGCSLRTLIVALQQREKWAAEGHEIPTLAPRGIRSDRGLLRSLIEKAGAHE